MKQKQKIFNPNKTDYQPISLKIPFRKDPKIEDKLNEVNHNIDDTYEALNFAAGFISKKNSTEDKKTSLTNKLKKNFHKMTFLNRFKNSFNNKNNTSNTFERNISQPGLTLNQIITKGLQKKGIECLKTSSSVRKREGRLSSIKKNESPSTVLKSQNKDNQNFNDLTEANYDHKANFTLNIQNQNNNVKSEGDNYNYSSSSPLRRKASFNNTSHLKNSNPRHSKVKDIVELRSFAKLRLGTDLCLINNDDLFITSDRKRITNDEIVKVIESDHNLIKHNIELAKLRPGSMKITTLNDSFPKQSRNKHKHLTNLVSKTKLHLTSSPDHLKRDTITQSNVAFRTTIGTETNFLMSTYSLLNQYQNQLKDENNQNQKQKDKDKDKERNEIGEIDEKVNISLTTTQNNKNSIKHKHKYSLNSIYEPKTKIKMKKIFKSLDLTRKTSVDLKYFFETVASQPTTKHLKTRNLVKNIRSNHLMSGIEKEIREEGNEMKNKKGCFVYSTINKGTTNNNNRGIYLSQDRDNIMRRSQYTEGIHTSSAFNARNIIFNKYNILIEKNEIFGFRPDYKKEGPMNYIQKYKDKVLENKFFKVEKLVYNQNNMKAKINYELDKHQK